MCMQAVPLLVSRPSASDIWHTLNWKETKYGLGITELDAMPAENVYNFLLVCVPLSFSDHGPFPFDPD